MYVYIQSEPQLWTTGFYSPDGKWHSDQDFDNPEKAGDRVAFLNGQNATTNAYNRALNGALAAINTPASTQARTDPEDYSFPTYQSDPMHPGLTKWKLYISLHQASKRGGRL